MDDQQSAKQISRRAPPPLTELDQVHMDFALAVALQEQESAFPMLTTTTTESNSDASDEDAAGDAINSDDDFFEDSQDILQADQLQFVGGGESNNDQEMEEDDIDPDELSYEELIALGEIVGEESKGLSPDQISSSLHPYSCPYVDCKTVIDRCVICQVEYEEGEKLVALSCDHPYHLECISKWLQIKKICPICSFEVSSPKIDKTL
ncbi:E3 ubiquitin ligase BIG BROTHER-related-like isoform X2 [Cornus florida]|uniref:E3 ubiquitin ligase BIG BROTHER-related-like isoform X2 n=1 Tax=Cornus florida TaxID=4283 RepID=UPI00289A5299|nr:E3 ubiquitin ligase BIG BROTHER-related-like isoform X2 [Cornus florida]